MSDKNETIPVQEDDEQVEAGGYEDAEQADSDAQLVKDDNDAIDEDNIIEERTRNAGKASGTYAEPSEDDI